MRVQIREPDGAVMLTCDTPHLRARIVSGVVEIWDETPQPRPCANCNAPLARNASRCEVCGQPADKPCSGCG